MSLCLVNLFKLLTLCALLQTIVGASSEMFPSRRERSSRITSPRSSSQQRQSQIDIRELFITGPEDTVVLFNQTNPHVSEMQNDQPYKKDPHRRVTSPFPNTVKYPQDNDDDHTTQFPDEPDCAENSQLSRPYCTKIRNQQEYQRLQAALKNEIAKFSVFFGEDEIEIPQPINVTQRMNTKTPYEEVLCESKKRVVYPQIGQTKNNTWLYVVNSEYKQGVLVEECTNVGATCNVVSVPNHITATCKQSYSYRTLVAIGPDNKNVTKESFRMPSCCKCVLESN